MWKRIKALTSLFVRSSFQNTSKKKKSRLIGYLVLVIYLGAVAIMMSREILKILIFMHQENSFPVMIVLSIFSMTFFTDLISGITMLFFSDDNLALLPLPVDSREFYLAKTLSIAIYSYIMPLFMGLAPLGMYGYMTEAPIAFYPVALLVVLTLPLIPAALAVAFDTVLMSLLKKLRSKSAVQLITSLISILFAMSISMFSSRTGSDEQMAMMLSNASEAIEKMQKYLPFLKLSADALKEVSLFKTLLSLLISLAVVALVVLTLHRRFIQTLTRVSFMNDGVSTKKMNESTAYQSKGVASSYIHKEVVSLIRKPIYVTQLLLPCFLVPLIVFASFYFSMQSDGIVLSEVLQVIYDDPDLLYDMVLPFVLMALLFTSMTCFLSVVAISKDGEDAIMMKMLPIPFYRQLIYKALPDIVMVNIIHLFTSILALISLKMPLQVILISLVTLLPYSLVHGALILLDLRHPKLHWSNEIQVTKNNLRTLLPIGLAILNIVLIVLALFWLEMDGRYIAAILFAAYSLIGTLIYLHARKKDFALSQNLL